MIAILTTPRLKKLLRYVWRNLGFRNLYLSVRCALLIREWQRIRAHTGPIVGGPASGVLIIPSDPQLLTASLGDQAMITSIISYWRRKKPEAIFYIIAGSAKAALEAKALDAHAIPLRYDGSLVETLASLSKNFEIAVLMGADGLDGAYDPYFSARQLILIDLAARRGAECYITGFSVSNTLHPGVRQCFDELSPRVRINLRDPTSFARFQSQSSAKAYDVADIAFLLAGSSSTRLAPLLRRIEYCKRDGRLVVVLNLHPLLLDIQSRQQLRHLVNAFFEILKNVAEQRQCTFLLLSHDCRGESADDLALSILEQQFRSCPSLDYLKVQFQPNASEVKELVKHVDAVISGRMHLLIATMGATTPAFGIDYMDKMEGLFRLMELESGDLTTATAIQKDPKHVERQLRAFLSDLGGRKDKLMDRKVFIRRLAESNFAQG